MSSEKLEKAMYLFKEGSEDKASKVASSMLDGVHLTKQDLINRLNKDIELEYSAAIQYIQHANLLQGSAFTGVKDELLKHADEEMEHAKILSDRVVYLGGTPTINVEKIFTAPDNLNMLRLDLNAERNAISRYSDRILEAMSLKEFGLVNVLQNILVEEEEHENDLLMALGSFVDPDPGNDIDFIDEAPPAAADVDYSPVMEREARAKKLASLIKD
jgi:bacterioferritin